MELDSQEARPPAPVSREAFEEWVRSPVWTWVQAAFRRNSEELRAAWVARSWEQGVLDPVELATLKAEADKADQLSRLDEQSDRDEETGDLLVGRGYDALLEIMGQEGT